MGACDFRNVGEGKTAEEAFRLVVADARHENGHGGYSGTIAEKRDFRVVRPTEAQLAPLIEKVKKSVQEMLEKARASQDGKVTSGYGTSYFTPEQLKKQVTMWEAKLVDPAKLREGAMELYADELMENDERANDKWGPALCLELRPFKFLFLGCASS